MYYIIIIYYYIIILFVILVVIKKKHCAATSAIILFSSTMKSDIWSSFSHAFPFPILTRQTPRNLVQNSTGRGLDSKDTLAGDVVAPIGEEEVLSKPRLKVWGKCEEDDISCRIFVISSNNFCVI